MPVTFQSVRFGAVEVPDADVFEFPHGLIGLSGHRYALLDRNPGTEFRWLHDVDDPALALPVVKPEPFFADFAIEAAPEELSAAGIEDLDEARVYVTVRAAPDPREITVNLRAPIVICRGRGFQILNAAAGASLQEPLFRLVERARSADAA